MSISELRGIILCAAPQPLSEKYALQEARRGQGGPPQLVPRGLFDGIEWRICRSPSLRLMRNMKRTIKAKIHAVWFTRNTP